MSSIVQKQIGVLTGNLPLVLTNETFVVSTGRCEANLPTLRAIIRCWVCVNQGTAGTGVNLRLRRGNGLAAPVVAVGPLVTIAALTTLDTSFIFAESLQNAEYAEYALTVALIGATGNGIVQNAAIEVEFING